MNKLKQLWREFQWARGYGEFRKHRVRSLGWKQTLRYLWTVLID